MTFLSEQARLYKKPWDDLLSECVTEGLISSEVDTLVEHTMAMPVSTLQEQVKLLSSISNYHWWASLDVFGKQKSSTTIQYSQHLLFSPVRKRKHLGSSPRNILMTNLLHLQSSKIRDPVYLSGAEYKFANNLMFLANYDRGVEQSVLFTKEQEPPSNCTCDGWDEDGPPFKKRRYASRVKVLSAATDLLLQEAGIAGDGGVHVVKNDASQRDLFSLFSESIHSSGFVQWRSHSAEKNVVIMNDYSDSTGVMKPLDYVHVTACKTESAELQIWCTCKIYQHMQAKALQKDQVREDVDTVLPANFTCMHCRFYSTYLVDIQDNLFREDFVNKLHAKVKQTEEAMNLPLVVLGEVFPHAATKFSALGETSFSVVNMSFTSSGCVVACQSGSCQSLNKSHTYSRRRLPRDLSLDGINKKGMCDHLLTVCKSKDLLAVLFPHYFNSELTSADETDEFDYFGAAGESVSDPVVNPDDWGIRNKVLSTVSFNVNEGKWECTAHSDLPTKDSRDHPDLVRSTEQRLKYFSGKLTPEGYRVGPSQSSVPAASETERPTCECGHYITQVLTRKTLVYTRQVSQFVPQFNPIVPAFMPVYFDRITGIVPSISCHNRKIRAIIHAKLSFNRESCSVKSVSLTVLLVISCGSLGQRKTVCSS